jgi:HSP20 family protein
MSKKDTFLDEYQSLLNDMMSSESEHKNLSVDISEENGDIIIDVDLAGIDPDNIDISLEGNDLHIRGYKEEIQQDEDRDYYMKEIEYGSFERVITLPHDVDIDQAEAHFEDGLLTVVLPHIEEEEPKKTAKSPQKKKQAQGQKKQAQGQKKQAQMPKKQEAKQEAKRK